MYKPCSKFEGKFETKKAVFLCNDGLGHPGQFVYIRDDREEQEYFGLCEVEVFEFTSKQTWFIKYHYLNPLKSKIIIFDRNHLEILSYKHNMITSG